MEPSCTRDVGDEWGKGTHDCITEKDRACSLSHMCRESRAGESALRARPSRAAQTTEETGRGPWTRRRTARIIS